VQPSYCWKEEKQTVDEAQRRSRLGDRAWRFRSREDGLEHLATLWLYPELECSSCVDDADDQSGPGHLAYYVNYVKRNYRQWWDADAVPIYWFVRGDPRVCEDAPNDYRHHDLPGENFLTFFTPPVDAKTGEPLNWWRLPVRNTRFPELARGLGWLPSPFQRFAPLRSIITNAVA